MTLLIINFEVCIEKIHFRITLEKVLRGNSFLDAMAIIDVGFQNVLPSLEWEAIRNCIDELIPELSNWTKWCFDDFWGLCGVRSWC